MLRELKKTLQPYVYGRIVDPPMMHIYAVRRNSEPDAVDSSEESHQIYSNIVNIAIYLTTKLDRSFTVRRKIHRYERRIKEIIRNNTQIGPEHPLWEDHIPDWFVWEQMRFLGSDYQAHMQKTNLLDDLLIEVEVRFDEIQAEDKRFGH